MSHRIARFFEPLLRFLLPSTGRHRLVAGPAESSPAAPSTEGPAVHRHVFRPLCGEDNALVRPYLLAHEQHREAPRRRARRRVLRLAVHGIDLGPGAIRNLGVAR
ncbi:hypothetical protein ACFSL4_27595 [Streptomyces caeni]|uniref:Uncharacterized protein n=1 Tax=Streptomyces caeni TaxID=2307231 RepID=A0ABW4IYW7_9ACTN